MSMQNPTTAEQDSISQWSIDRFAALQHIGRELNATLDLDRILHVLIEQAVTLTPAMAGCTFVLDPGQGRLQPHAGYARRPGQPELAHISQDSTLLPGIAQRFKIVDQAFTAGAAVLIDDASGDPPTSPVFPGSRSVLAVPICYGAETVGVLDLESTQAAAFGPADRQFALAVAEEAATAIGNSRRYAEEVARENAARRRNDQLRELIAISHVLHMGHALDDILDQIVQAIPATVGFNVAMLSLAEGEPPMLRRVAAAGITLQQFEAMRQTRQWLSAFDLVLQEPYRVSQSYFLPHQQEAQWSAGLDVHVILDEQLTREKDALLPRDPSRPPWHPRDMLLVPLRDSRGQVLGLLSIDDPQDGFVPDRERIESLELFANEAASAIENARLYDELELRVQKRTEELAHSLRQQAAEVDKTRAIVESISDAVIVCGPDDRVILANPATVRVLGFEPAMLLQRSLDDEFDGLEGKEAETARALFQVARSARQSLRSGQDLVNTVFQAVGRVIHAGFSATTLQAGEPLTMVAVLRDITHEAEVNRLKSESISMAAHELRTPLTTITSYVDVLMQGVVGPANEAQQEFLQVIRTNASRLMTLVTGLLDAAKIESQGLTLNLRPVSMAEVVDEAVRALQKQIDDKHQVLTVHVPANLPQVIADREWMVQVVTNLVSNAHKYSPPGGQVAIRGRVAEGQLRLEVQDSGIGISPQDQKLVFTRFFRADNALVTQEGGTGLGLAICREIVVRHGGKVQVDSEVGKGSTFSILLPCPDDARMCP